MFSSEAIKPLNHVSQTENNKKDDETDDENFD
jgi:hypothetical protein